MMNRVAALLILVTLMAGCLEAEPLTEEEYREWGLVMTDEVNEDVLIMSNASLDWADSRISDREAIRILTLAGERIDRHADTAAGITPPDVIGNSHTHIVRALDLFVLVSKEGALCIETYEISHCEQAEESVKVANDRLDLWIQAIERL